MPVISINNKSSMQHGAVTLLITIILFIVSTLIIIFAGNFGAMQQKTAANVSRNGQAFTAAEAGLEYAINYLQKNSSTIMANPVSGYIPAYSDANITNVTLANNSKFTIVYNNPAAYDYSLIKVTSTGTSADGSSTRVVSQLVQMGSIIANTGTTALATKGSVILRNSSNVTNILTDQTITSAGTVTFNSGSYTTTSTGGSSSGNIGADVQQNNSYLSGLSQNSFIANYLGSSTSNSIQSKVSLNYSSSIDRNYTGNLNGISGTSVYINQTSGIATIGDAIIGTTTNPVLLIVNGTLRLTNTLSFTGFIINISPTGTTTITGHAQITGGVATLNDLILNNETNIIYSSTVLTNLLNLSSMKYYAKVLGSWKDF